MSHTMRNYGDETDTYMPGERPAFVIPLIRRGTKVSRENKTNKLNDADIKKVAKSILFKIHQKWMGKAKVYLAV